VHHAVAVLRRRSQGALGPPSLFSRKDERNYKNNRQVFEDFAKGHQLYHFIPTFLFDIKIAIKNL